jgi:hypothetical protein
MKIVLVSLVMLLGACSNQKESSLSNDSQSSEVTTIKLTRGNTVVVENENSNQVSLQYLDSGFNYNTTDLKIDGEKAEVVNDQSAKACFEGKITRVCGMLESMSEIAYDSYQEGDHDLIRLTACRVKGPTVVIDYAMTTDYDEYEILATKELSRCSQPGKAEELSTQANKYQQLIGDANYMSETDSEWTAFYSEKSVDEEFSEASLRAALNAGSHPVDVWTEEQAMELFEMYINDNPYEEADDVAQYTALREAMLKDFKELRVVMVGEHDAGELTIYILGRNDSGKIVGLRALAVET